MRGRSNCRNRYGRRALDDADDTYDRIESRGRRRVLISAAPAATEGMGLLPGVDGAFAVSVAARARPSITRTWSELSR